MTYTDFISKITNSKPEEWIYDDELGLYVYKGNINISIVSDRSKEYSDEFYEDWVKMYPDPKGHRHRFFLKYRQSIIETFYAVAVDGDRMFIPYPKSVSDLKISIKQYNLGKIINIPYQINDFNYYLKLAGIEIES